MPDWPTDPNGSLEPVLSASLAASQARHPSTPTPGALLSLADRCDAECSAAALYRVAKFDAADRPLLKNLDFCRHHFFKHFPIMCQSGNWKCIGSNPELFAALENQPLEEAP